MTTAPARSHAAYLTRPAPDPAWAARGACRAHPDPDLWFATGHCKTRQREAIAICRACPVRVPCIAYALSVPGLAGIWAATTANKRARLRNSIPKPVPPRPRAA
jgi:WhiB family transcriptional regulator, redox-sensing transcriptional regulator